MRYQTIPFELVGGHVLLQLDGLRVLLDTGSPTSFGRANSLSLLGKTHRLNRTKGRPQVASIIRGLRRHAPVPPSFTFDVLLGLDLLRGTNVKIDWKRQEVTLRRSLRGRAGPPKYPCRQVLVGRRLVRAILDTGAWRSYLHPEVAVGLRRIGSVKDYSPLLGGFTAKLVRTQVRYKGDDSLVAVGVATPELAGALDGLGVRMIVGIDIMAASRNTTFDFGRSPRGGVTSASALTTPWSRQRVLAGSH